MCSWSSLVKNECQSTAVAAFRVDESVGYGYCEVKINGKNATQICQSVEVGFYMYALR